MNVYIKIAQLYLEDEDHVTAEAYVNRAGLLQAEVSNKELHIKYKVSQLSVPFDIQILDSLRCIY